MENPATSGLPQTLPTHRLKRVQSAAAFYAPFRPLFRRIVPWPTGIPCEPARRRTAVARLVLLELTCNSPTSPLQTVLTSLHVPGTDQYLISDLGG